VQQASGHGIRDKVRGGMRDEGSGIRDEGLGIRDEGLERGRK
jgi:hypothetical protein